MAVSLADWHAVGRLAQQYGWPWEVGLADFLPETATEQLAQALQQALEVVPLKDALSSAELEELRTADEPWLTVDLHLWFSGRLGRQFLRRLIELSSDSPLWIQPLKPYH